MGVTYKLEQKIRDFILEQRKANPKLSCRKIADLIVGQFQVKVSKSSVHFVIKEASLNMSVGRRQVKAKNDSEPSELTQVTEVKLAQLPMKTLFLENFPEDPKEDNPAEPPVILVDNEPAKVPCSGVILLKAAEYLVGGIYYITEAIKNGLGPQKPNLFSKTEYLLYEQIKPNFGLEGIINKNFSPEEISSHLYDLQSVTTLASDMFKIVSAVFQEVRYVMCRLSDGSIFYLDAQLHTIWSTPNIPYDFSSTIYNIKGYIKRCFQEISPLVLLTAPGYDYPTPEFFNFILSLDQNSTITLSSLALCGNKFEELEGLSVDKDKRRFFVFGLWPWQYAAYRKVNRLGEFRPYHFAALKKDYYIADIEVELSQPNTRQSVTLRGCVLKTNLAEKVRLIILSNLSEKTATPEMIADTYLNSWPNLEEGFRNYSRKIELFTYTADSQRLFYKDNLNLLINQEHLQDIGSLLDYYLKALDLYVRRRFFPSGYEDKDFSTMKQYFYSLKAEAERKKDFILVTLQTPAEFPYLNELEFACRSVNEAEIRFLDGRRLWVIVQKTLS